MKINLIVLSSTVVLVVGLLFLGLLSRQPTTSQERTSSSEYNVGVIAPLSGPYSSYGGYIAQGVELAKSVLSEQGLELRTYYEDACLPADGVRAAKKLIGENQISALVGNYCVVSLAAMYREFERGGVPLFHSTVAPGELLSASKYIIPMTATVAEEAEALANYTYNQLGARTVGTFYITTQWGEEFSQEFKRRFAKYGGMVTAEFTHPIGSMDFRTELARAKATAPDVLFFAHLGAELGELLKQARQQGLEQQVISVDDTEDSVVLEAAQGAAEGVIFFSPEPIGNSFSREQFEQRFSSTYQQLPHPLAHNAFVATIRAGRAIKSCANKPACIANLLHEQSTTAKESAKFTLVKVQAGQFVRFESED